MLTKKLLVEALGTFALLFAGMLAIANNASLLGVAFAHGLAIAVMAMALGGVSGGQFNPAVSIGLSAAGYQDWKTTAMYIPAQLIGAALGGVGAIAVAGVDALKTVGFGNPALASGTGIVGGLVGEMITTMFLVLVVVKVAVQGKHIYAPLFIGLTITVGILAIGPETGASLNPARAFGSAIVGGGFANHWVYWVGPILGGILGALFGSFTGTSALTELEIADSERAAKQNSQ